MMSNDARDVVKERKTGARAYEAQKREESTSLALTLKEKKV